MEHETKIYETIPQGFCPKVEVAATYVNVGGKILLLELSDFKPEPRAWGVPAGKLEANELPINGAKRELLEETGIQVMSEDVYESLGQLYIRKPHIDYVYHLFGINLERLPAIQLSSEHLSHKWVSKEEAVNLPLMNGAIGALDFYYRQMLTKHSP